MTHLDENIEDSQIDPLVGAHHSLLQDTFLEIPTMYFSFACESSLRFVTRNESEQINIPARPQQTLGDV